MNVESDRTAGWTPCRSGSLQSFGRRAKFQRRLRGITRAAGAAAVLLCVVGLSAWSASRFTGEREYYFGGIACHEVRANLDAYAIGTLTDELAKQMETHLKECPACWEIMKQMNEGQVSSVSRPEANCHCQYCQLSLGTEAQFATWDRSQITYRIRVEARR